MLVHGWGADATSWREHVPRLEDDFTVLAPDLPGHGTTPADDPVSIRALTSALAGLVEGHAPVVLVGHSMGAQPCVLLADRRPELVRAVVVIDPAYGAEDIELATAPARLADLRRRGTAAAAEFVDDALRNSHDRALWERTRAQMLGTDGRVLAQLFHSMYLADDALGGRPAAEKVLTRLKVPLLSLHSSRPAADWARSIALPSGSEVVHWPGRSHYLHQERPAEFCALLRGWLIPEKGKRR